MFWAMYSLGWPATTPPLASTASWLTTDATGWAARKARKEASTALKVTSKVKSSTTRVSATLEKSSDCPSGSAISTTRSHEYFTSSAVMSVPSEKTTPSRSGKV